MPPKWKGLCQADRGFAPMDCNRKIVGARIFYSGYKASSGPINETAELKSPRRQHHVVKEAGGIGIILTNTMANGEELVADSHLLSVVDVGEIEGITAKKYTKTATKPTSTLSFSGTKIGIRPSPVVAVFSSRGPNYLTLEILKPDLIAIGVNILAAWSGDASPSILASDRRRVGFNILSGTSMSCPHIAGVAALLKASHPDWSPAQIKSALMTTAYVHDNTYRLLKDAATGEASTPFQHGAGHIHPRGRSARVDSTKRYRECSQRPDCKPLVE
uniref:Uncharacterized protein n=1 Tax=Avena sativa TaxID=4498 RepID=A0ACD5ZV42_AVESA